ncbi:hypothetical protein CsSME_00027263 [Camellia sinensis var. sinensis]
MGKCRFMVNSPGAIAEFHKDYNIPNDVHLSLAELDTTPWEKLGFVPFTIISIVETGLRFPVQPLTCEFLGQTRLCLTQLSTNTYRIINGITELNRQLGLNLGLAELFHQYSLDQNDDGWVYYLRVILKTKKPRYRTPFVPRSDTVIVVGLSCVTSNQPTGITKRGRPG